MAVLSGFENESVVFQQGDRIGSEFVQVWVAQPEWRLRTTRRTLLAQNVRDIVSAKGVGLSGFLNGCGHIFWAVLPDQL
jgi:hypothetical protein